MGKTDTQEKIGGRIDAVRVIGGFVGRFFKLKQGPRFFTCTRRVDSVKTKRVCEGEGTPVRT